MKLRIVLHLCATGLIPVLPQVATQAADAVPEPGLIVYGQVYSQSAPTKTVAMSAIVWNNSPGGTGTIVTSSAYPAAPEVAAFDSSYYIARIPYETVTPAGLTLEETSFFNLPAAVDDHRLAFTVTPLAGGGAKPARVKTSGATFFSWGAAGNEITTGNRGRVVRVDLLIDAAASGDPFPDWMGGYLSPSDPRAAATFDADGDGMTNEQEYAANTSPVDAADVLRILSITVPGGNTTTLSWASKAGLTYTLEYSDALTGGWISHGTYTGAATGQTAASNLPMTSPQAHRFWRVRVTR